MPRHAARAARFGFPNLTDDEWQWGGDFDSIKTTIRGGRTAAMPAWGTVLGDAGTADMAQYVLSLVGRAARRGRGAARAHRSSQTLCVACHGPEGKGNPLFGAPDLTNDIWLYGGDADTIAFTIRNGRGGQMPRFETSARRRAHRHRRAYVSGLRRQ